MPSETLTDSRNNAEPNIYVVSYAKVVDDKRDGIYLQGVYFGGVGSTLTEADAIARECVNSGKGGTILPKVIPSYKGGDILQALQVASKQFNQMEHQMLQAEEIYDRSSRK